MNFRTYLSAAALLSSVFLLSCGEGDQAGDGQHADTTAGAAAGQGLSVSLEDVPDIQQFPDAGLALGNVSGGGIPDIRTPRGSRYRPVKEAPGDPGNTKEGLRPAEG